MMIDEIEKLFTITLVFLYGHEIFFPFSSTIRLEENNKQQKNKIGIFCLCKNCAILLKPEEHVM